MVVAIAERVAKAVPLLVVVVARGGFGGRALHPVGTNPLRPRVRHRHARVVELPEVLPLEEVGLTVDVLEGRVYAAWDAPPHRYVPGVVELHPALGLVEPPILGSCETNNVMIFCEKW